MIVKRFLEKNLDLKSLDDIKGGESRGQKLVKKLKQDGEFKVAPKNKFEKDVKFVNHDDVVDQITDPNDEYNKEKAKDFFQPQRLFLPVLKGDDSKDYKLNDLKKDEYFGGGGGSSLGFHKTREMESIQCIFLALKQHLINIPNLKRFHLEFLYDDYGDLDEEIMKYVKIPIEITADHLTNFIQNDKGGWVDTFINTANALYLTDLQLVGKNQRTVFKKQKRYTFHQIGAETPLINAIVKSYNRCKEVKGSPISKWTPSDIWAVESVKENQIVTELNNCGDIKSLNNVIDTRFLRNNLIGVSLKKIGHAESIKLVINKLTPAPKYRFDSIITSQDPLGSMGVKLVANFKSEVLRDGKDTMYLRSFSGTNTVSNISGEVEGQYSRYGKIGLEWINKILLKNGIMEDDLIPTKNEILSDPSFSDEFLKSEITRMNKIISDKADPTKRRIQTRPSLISKYQALRFGVLMVELSKSDEDLGELEGESTQMVDKITEDILYYAMSIKNYNFECPMYVRIVSNKS
jgi:hypothetical protein